MKTPTLLLAFALALGASSTARAQALTQVTQFGSNPGGLRMWKYVPANVPDHAPLVLALHGCSQQAADYVKAGWNALADRYKFYVLYPEQTTSNNALTCFNWSGTNPNPVTGENDPATLARGQGENQSIKQMIDQMKKDYSIDDKRVFISGLSSGGAETALMLATWPDLFAAGATFAGIPYRCTTNNNQLANCVNPGVVHTPKEWGDLVRSAYPGYTGPWPRIAIWQGTADSLVSTTNQTELMKQWTNVHGLSQTPTASDTVAIGVSRDLYTDPTGAAAVEVLKVANMDHGVPIDPKSGCGTAAPYFLDVGVCSAAILAADWGLTATTAGADGGTTNADGGTPSVDGGTSGDGDMGAGSNDGGIGQADGGVSEGSSDGGPGAGPGLGAKGASGCSLSGSAGPGGALPFAILLLGAAWSRRRTGSRAR